MLTREHDLHGFVDVVFVLVLRDHSVWIVERTAVDTHGLQVDQLLQGHVAVIVHSTIYELHVPVFVCCLNLKLLHGDSHRKGLLLRHLHLLEPNVDIADRELDIVEDLGRQV